jgi:thioredoxin 1
MEEAIMHRSASLLPTVSGRIAHRALAAALLITLSAAALNAPTPCFAASPAARPLAEDHIVPVSFLSFGSKVLNAEMPVVVDFSAPWCVPCRAVEKSLAAVAAAAGGRVRVARVNVTWSQGLAKRYGVEALPTLLIFDHGVVVERATGALDPDDIRDLLTSSTHVALTAALPAAAAAGR